MPSSTRKLVADVQVSEGLTVSQVPVDDLRTRIDEAMAVVEGTGTREGTSGAHAAGGTEARLNRARGLVKWWFEGTLPFVMKTLHKRKDALSNVDLIKGDAVVDDENVASEFNSHIYNGRLNADWLMPSGMPLFRQARLYVRFRTLIERFDPNQALTDDNAALSAEEIMLYDDRGLQLGDGTWRSLPDCRRTIQALLLEQVGFEAGEIASQDYNKRKAAGLRLEAAIKQFSTTWNQAASEKADTPMKEAQLALARKDKLAAARAIAQAKKLSPDDVRLRSLNAEIAALPDPRSITLDIGGGEQMVFLRVPPGSFMMGCEKGEDHEAPVHKVTITKAFYMTNYEVTVEQWEAVMRDKKELSSPGAGKEPALPYSAYVDGLCNASRFLNRLSRIKPVASFRLPTEAEWEYTCRAGSNTLYSFGDDRRYLGDYAWFADNSAGKPHLVGQKKPNLWGFYDMHGNAPELCQDMLEDYKNGEQTDPVEEGRGPGRSQIVRGGSYCSSGDEVRSAHRTWHHNNAFGFRVVLVPFEVR